MAFHSVLLSALLSLYQFLLTVLEQLSGRPLLCRPDFLSEQNTDDGNNNGKVTHVIIPFQSTAGVYYNKSCYDGSQT